jgi:hypothetical protein
MRIHHSSKARAREIDSDIHQAVASVSIDYLREIVEAISIPRHFFAEHRNNQLVAGSIASEFERLGYDVHYQGAWSNLVAKKECDFDEGVILIGAHYDSVPSTPGADDNAICHLSFVIGHWSYIRRLKLRRRIKRSKHMTRD